MALTEQDVQQVAQAVAQAARQVFTERSVVDASRTAGSQEVGAEREFETGKDEAWFANIKRTYDEYQHESLESIRRNRQHFDKVVSDAQQHDNVRQAIANQALQSAVETANMVAKNAVSHQDGMNKQHTAHRDIATDSYWGAIEHGAADTLRARSVSIDDASLKAIGAMVAAAVAQAMGAART